MLTQAAKPHGVYPHTSAERTVLENLWLKGLVLPSCNGTQKWHATKVGREALCDCQHPVPTPSGFAAISEDCPIHGGDFQTITTVL